MKTHRACLLPLVLLTGCITVPRAGMLGMTAAPVGAGRTELGLAAGLGILSETEPPRTQNFIIFTQQDWTSRAGASLLGEANVQHGLNDWLGLNLHVSQAGVQPGLKVTLLEREVTLGLLPEVGFGLLGGNTWGTQYQGSTKTEGTPVSEMRWVLAAGVRLLVSHPGSGLYSGAGYQLQAAGLSQSTGTGTDTVTQSTTNTLHNLQVAFGWEGRFGNVRVRPELAAVFTPEWTIREKATTAAGASTETLRGGGSGVLVLPNVTFALVADAPRRTVTEEDDDEDEAPRRRKGAQRRRSTDDDAEDGERP